MKRRKTFYYKTEHFIAVSGMLYRMKQNAAGLAGICVLSTSVMVMLSSTVSLYSGINDVLENRFVRDISLKTGDIDDSVRERMDQIVADVLQEKVPGKCVSLQGFCIFGVRGDAGGSGSG